MNQSTTTFILNSVLKQMREDLDNGLIEIKTSAVGRSYVTNDGNIEIPIGETKQTAFDYYNKIIVPQYFSSNKNVKQKFGFDQLPRVSIYVGQPDTGKTYSAINLCKEYNVDYVFLMARDTLTLETLLQDFTVVDGKPVFKESLAIKYLSDDDYHVIIIDEFNTLLTGVMKTLQPILDDTSTTFEFNGKVYKKNLKCKFIFTLNDKDKGISTIPDAILSRSYIKYFDPVDTDVLATWSNSTKQQVECIKKLFTLLNITNLFGTRQIKVIKNLKDDKDIKNHFKGILSLNGSDMNKSLTVLDSIEAKTLITQISSPQIIMP